MVKNTKLVLFQNILLSRLWSISFSSYIDKLKFNDQKELRPCIKIKSFYSKNNYRIWEVQRYLMNICRFIMIEYDKQRSNSVTTFEGLRYALQNSNVPLQLMLKCIVEKRLWVIQSTWEFWVSVSLCKIWYSVCVNLCVNWKLILQRPSKLNTFTSLY